MANCIGCGASNLGMSRASLVLVDGEWYCKACLKKMKGTVACKKCGKEAFVSDEHFKTVDGQYLCTDCMEKMGIMKKYDYIMQSVLSLKSKAPAKAASSSPATSTTSSLGGLRQLLDENLSPGEEIVAAVMGNAGEALAFSPSHLFILKSGIAAGSLTGKKCIKYSWHEVRDVEIKAGALYGLIEVKGNGFPTFDPKDITKAKQADNVVTFLVNRKNEFDEALSGMKPYLNS